MIKEYKLKCAVSILNFLILSEYEYYYERTSNVKSNSSMIELLRKFNHTMVSFTEYLNSEYNILSEPLWDDSPSEFFSNSDKSLKFFIDVLNKIYLDEKIELGDSANYEICTYCGKPDQTVNKNLFDGLCADCTEKVLYEHVNISEAKINNKKNNEISSW